MQEYENGRKSVLASSVGGTTRSGAKQKSGNDGSGDTYHVLTAHSLLAYSDLLTSEKDWWLGSALVKYMESQNLLPFKSLLELVRAENATRTLGDLTANTGNAAFFSDASNTAAIAISEISGRRSRISSSKSTTDKIDNGASVDKGFGRTSKTDSSNSTRRIVLPHVTKITPFDEDSTTHDKLLSHVMPPLVHNGDMKHFYSSEIIGTFQDPLYVEELLRRCKDCADTFFLVKVKETDDVSASTACAGSGHPSNDSRRTRLDVIYPVDSVNVYEPQVLQMLSHILWLLRQNATSESIASKINIAGSTDDKNANSTYLDVSNTLIYEDVFDVVDKTVRTSSYATVGQNSDIFETIRAILREMHVDRRTGKALHVQKRIASYKRIIDDYLTLGKNQRDYYYHLDKQSAKSQNALTKKSWATEEARTPDVTGSEENAFAVIDRITVLIEDMVAPLLGGNSTSSDHYSDTPADENLMLSMHILDAAYVRDVIAFVTRVGNAFGVRVM